MRQGMNWLTREAGIRFLAGRKAACAVAVLTMALALGANTLVFSVVDTFLRSSFAVPEADRMYVIAPLRDLGSGEGVILDAYPNYRMIREEQRSFADVAVYQQGVVSWSDGVEARPLQSTRASASFFSTTVQPALGRGFREDEEGRSPAPVAVISNALWRSAFGGTADVLGRSMTINGSGHTIVGVMPEGFVLPLPTDIWLPFTLTNPAAWSSIAGARSLGLYGRLKEGVTFEAATAEMAELTKLSLEASADNKDFRYDIRTIQQVVLPGADRTLFFVQAGALLLVLLAVSNLASLLIAWGFDRRKEIAVRLALGSRNGAIVRMLLLQGLVVVSAGGIAGVIIAQLALPLVRSLEVTPVLRLFLSNLRLDASVLAWSALAVGVASLLAGALPAWFAFRANVAGSLRSESRGASLSPAAVRWQKGLVLGQSMLSVMILGAAALIGMSFYKLSQVSPGFQAEERVIARIPLSDARYATHAARTEFTARLLDNFGREPELAAYAFTSALPLGDGGTFGRFYRTAADATDPNKEMVLYFRRVSPEYTETLGIPLVGGRSIEARDDSAAVRVAVISATLANRFWPNESAIGKPLYRASPAGLEQLEVVGIVGDVTDAGLNEPAGATVYVPYAQQSVPQISVVAVGRSSIDGAASAIRNALKATDPLIAPSQTAVLPSLLRQSTALPRFQTILLMTFGLVALSMVILGSYGVMSQVVSTREREFALRLLFGAAPASLGASVLRQVTLLSASGAAIGLAVIAIAGEALRPFLFGVEPRSMALLAGVALVILALSAAAALPPALRAMRVRIERGIA